MSPALKFGTFAFGVLLVSMTPVVLFINGVDGSGVPATFGAVGILVGLYLAALALKGRRLAEVDIPDRLDRRKRSWDDVEGR